MSLKTDAEEDIAEVIAENPVEVTRSDGSTFNAAPGPATDDRFFMSGGREFAIDGSLLCLASDVETINPQDRITVEGKGIVAVADVQPDQLGAGRILTYQSVSKS